MEIKPQRFLNFTISFSLASYFNLKEIAGWKNKFNFSLVNFPISFSMD